MLQTGMCARVLELKMEVFSSSIYPQTQNRPTQKSTCLMFTGVPRRILAICPYRKAAFAFCEPLLTPESHSRVDWGRVNSKYIPVGASIEEAGL